jgi:Holliday junction DNA helicase RuvA
MDTPRLLAALVSNLAPTFDALACGGGQAFFAAFRLERNNARNAEFGGLLDHPFETVELDQGRKKCDRGQRFSFNLFNRYWFENPEDHTAGLGIRNFRKIHALIVGDLVLLSGFGAQYACQVPGIFAAQLSETVLNPLNEKTASRHRAIVRPVQDQGSVCRVAYYGTQRMIAVLRGILLEKHPNQAIVEAGGVGYDVHIPISTFTHLPEAGAEVRLRIYTHVREDTLSLYGFVSQDEKNLFEKLIAVSGIGPSLAIKVLSGLAAPDLISAIRQGEIDRLVRIPGVGKKTAERIVLELRDKLPAPTGQETEPARPALSEVDQDVLSALLNLGCARPAAEAAVRKAKSGGTPSEFEPLFRRSLELVR